MRFVWDSRKAASNVKKHGVTFEEAESAALDPLAWRDLDPVHDDGREQLIGWSAQHRTLFVVLLEVAPDDVTRIISARRAASEERRHYEESKKTRGA